MYNDVEVFSCHFNVGKTQIVNENVDSWILRFLINLKWVLLLLPSLENITGPRTHSWLIISKMLYSIFILFFMYDCYHLFILFMCFMTIILSTSVWVPTDTSLLESSTVALIIMVVKLMVSIMIMMVMLIMLSLIMMVMLIIMIMTALPLVEIDMMIVRMMMMLPQKNSVKWSNMERMFWDFAKIRTIAAPGSQMHCINQAIFKKGKIWGFSETSMRKNQCTLCVIC